LILKRLRVRLAINRLLASTLKQIDPLMLTKIDPPLFALVIF